jgi:hypothetical protein
MTRFTAYALAAFCSILTAVPQEKYNSNDVKYLFLRTALFLEEAERSVRAENYN